MKIDNALKPELVCSKDATRPILQQAYLKGDRLVATNGRSLAVIPVEREDGDTDGFISPAALKAARKLAKRRDAVSIKANGCLALADGTQLPRTEPGQFPNYEQVIPKTPEESHKITLALDAKMLLDLAQALGSDKVKLCITGGDTVQPILVSPLEQNRFGAALGKAKEGAFGVLMPIRLT